MNGELVYTSAPRGLRPGSRGFCTVAVTAGMPQPLAERLESLSGYRPLVPATEPDALARNPVNVAHYRLNVGGRTVSVISRVAFAGLDYTQRSNKIAHHILVDAADQSPAGPAWLAGQPKVFVGQWTGEPAMLPPRGPLPRGAVDAAPCHAWQQHAGDAGWAGLLAESATVDPGRACWIIVPPGIDPLPLIAEAVALVPVTQRWRVTFSTYFTDAPGDATCAWRCVIAGTPAAQTAARAPAGTVLVDLTLPQPLPPTQNDNPWVIRARTGAALPAVVPETAGAVATPDRATRPQTALHRLAPAGGSIDLGPAEIDAEPTSRKPAAAAPSGSTSTALAVAAACVISAGLGALIAAVLLGRRPAELFTSPPPAPTTATASASPPAGAAAVDALTQERDKALKEVAQSQSQKDELSKLNASLRSKIADLQNPGGLTDTVKDLQAQLKAAGEQKADLARQLADAQNRASGSAVEKLQKALAATPDLAPLIDQNTVVDLPPSAPTRPATFVLPVTDPKCTWAAQFFNGQPTLDLVAGPTLTFTPPADVGRPATVKWTKKSSSKLGPADDHTVALLAYDDSQKCWTLTVQPFDAWVAPDLARVLYQHLRWMTLNPNNGGHLIQLLRPEDLAMPLGSDKPIALFLPAIRSKSDGSVKPFVPKLSCVSLTDWQSLQDAPNGVTVMRRVTDNAVLARFKFVVTPVPGLSAADATDTVKVDSDWLTRGEAFKAAYTLTGPLDDLVRGLSEDIDALDALVPDPQKGQVRDIKQKIGDWRGKLGSYKSLADAFAAFDQKHADAYSDVSDLVFPVTLPNGTVVAHLLPQPPAPAATQPTPPPGAGS